MSLVYLIQSARRTARPILCDRHQQRLGRTLSVGIVSRKRIASLCVNRRILFRRPEPIFLPSDNTTLSGRLTCLSAFEPIRRYRSDEDGKELLLVGQIPPAELDEIYSSPLRLFRSLKTPDSFETSSIFISSNGHDEQWFTTRINFTRTHFNSGKFGGFLKTLRQSQCDEIFYKTLVVDGKVYYTSEDIAEEAAAARALDLFAFTQKYRERTGYASNEKLQPLRYCVEMPLIKRKTYGLFSCAPEYDWLCVMQQKYGPVDVTYDVRTELFGSDDNGGQIWFSATCYEPVTKEAFDSGIFAKNGYKLPLPHAPIDPLTMEEIKIRDGRVYYREEQIARHAAAARALDCFSFRNQISRSIVDISDEPIQWRICLEEPYMSKDEKLTQTIDYSKLQNIVTTRRLDPDAELLSDTLSGMLQSSSHSGLLHVPLKFIKLLFDNSKRGALRSSVHLKCFRDNNDVWYTSCITDPLTGEDFFSGVVGEESNTKMNKHSLRSPLHLAEVKVSEGKVYYKDKNLSLHAAAARAIDCYIFRDTGRPLAVHAEPAPKVQLCLEDPYRVSDERDTQLVDYKELLSKRNAPGECIPESISPADVPEPFDESLAYMLQTKSYLLHVPSRFLVDFFQKFYSKVPKYSVYEKVFCECSNDKWYTSTVTDPLTGEEFHSGSIGREINITKKKGNLLGTPLHLAKVKVSDGRVYYQNENLAAHAAAARAIDCFIFRNKFGVNAVYQMCLEDPYASDSEGDAKHVDYDALPIQRSHFMTSGYSGEDERASKGDHIVHFEDSGSDDDETDEKPQFLADNSRHVIRGSTLSTMGRIAEIWTEEQMKESLHTVDRCELTQYLGEQDPAETKLNNVLAWYRRAYKSPQTHDDATALSSLCKRVLSNLCECNTGNKLADSVGVNIQQEAQHIWEKLNSLQLRFGDDASFIDTSTCNAYIGCLDLYDPTSPTSAEALLHCMRDGNKNDDLHISLPRPNVDTYNAVLSLWSKANSLERETGVNRVYSLLQNSSLCPNMDTFKILMTTRSKEHDNRFSLKKAKTCLAEMQEVSKRSGNQNLRPNLDVYNAALKKPIIGVPHSHYKPSWLDGGKAFADGFRDAENLRGEGLEMEEWFALMEKHGVKANIDSYEAIIETWVNTGTLDGLLRAENWAKRVLMLAADRSNEDLTPRHETFHPIIASWTLCGNELSPRRVTEWLNQLTALSTAMPYLSPDINTLASKIIAWRRFQARTILTTIEEKTNNTSFANERDLSSEVDNAFQLARNCCNSLEEILSENTNFAGLVDAEACAPIFVNCIAAFGDASRLAKQGAIEDPEFSLRLGVQDMIKVTRLFDSKLDKALQVSKGETGVNKHTIQCIGEIYSEVASWLHHLDSTSTVNPGHESSIAKMSIFGERIADIERMLRRYEYFSRNQALSGSSDVDCKTTRLNFYKEILRGCKGIQNSSDHGNIVRICNLIMDYLVWSEEHRVDEFTTGGDDISDLFVDITLITGKCAIHPRERKLVLTKVYENACQFFDHGDKTTRFGRVDRSNLIGSLRLALADVDDRESFLRSFEEQSLKQRRALTQRHSKV
ncbi:hypothetical protein HJC23_008664 [Cyclotella cryptica]|uniref:Uncharacterized protein n=1 Tax=Cyclotella cryptica TaxID=29204 RepID=A0ABD3QH83_9STRA|eukprot:CCRYP_005370-RA/>CCRYP_005370-RA protein AED:0.01 eAED:0.01 QI:1833/1/1/1/1/1/3/83/1564